MKVAIVGATGRTGEIMLRRALERGHEVTAAVRRPPAVIHRHDRLRVVQADVLRPATLDAAMAGQDAAIMSISVAHGLREGRRPTTLFSEGARNLTDAMRRHSVRRLVALSSSAVHPDPALGVVFGKVMRPLLFGQMYADMARMEERVRSSGLEWVIVRPSMLTDDPAQERYILGIDCIPRGWRVSRADVAELVLDQLDHQRHLGRAVAITS